MTNHSGEDTDFPGHWAHTTLPTETQGEAFETLKAYVVSDVHLNNHPYARELQRENPRRKNFRLFLTRLNQELKPNDRLLLILNGDILDITGSWFEDVVPWSEDQPAVLKALRQVLKEIIENNGLTFQELALLLARSNTQVVYVYGNHDGMLQQYPESQALIQEALEAVGPMHGSLEFMSFFASEELGLYIEHGHLQDPFNRRCKNQHEPPLGDVINVLMVNRFVEMTVTRLREVGYSEAFITRLHTRLHDIEYLRPLALLPVWIQTVAHDYGTHPESLQKPIAVQDILVGVIAEILQDSKMVDYLTRQFHFPRPVWRLLINTTLRIPSILPLVSFIASKMMHHTHSNKYQYRAAQKLYREKGYRLLAFGHTHIPGVLPLSDHAYYFNTGSWKPVINLFKVSKDPVELEYLNPDVQFNKVERCGILHIEKNTSAETKPAEFSLQTIQSGLG